MTLPNGQKRRGPMRIVVLVGGVLLTLIGLALLVLPGPGIPVLIGGMLLLGEEIPAVHRLLHRVRRWVHEKREARREKRVAGHPERSDLAQP